MTQTALDLLPLCVHGPELVSDPDTEMGLRGGRVTDLYGNVITLVDGDGAQLMTGRP